MIAPLSRSLLVLAVVCLFIPGCGSSARRGPATPVPEVVAMTPRATGDVPFERAWELQLPGKVERSWISEQLPDLLFFQMQDTHEIHCVDSRSGQTRWISEKFRQPILGDANVQRQVTPGEREREVVVEDRLYFIVDDTLYCLDVGTGQRAWHLVLPFAPSTGPLAAGATEGSLRVFIGDWNNRIQVVAMHQASNDRQNKFPFVIWQMNTPGAILAQGTESEDQVYLGDTSGTLRCLKLDRDLVWEVPTGGAVDGGATTRGRILYAGNASNAVHALNRLNGLRLGQFNLQGPVRERPFWFTNEPERLYVWVDSPNHNIGGLVALRAQPDNVAITTAINDTSRHSNEVVRFAQDWRVPGATRLLASTPLHLLVGDSTRDMVWAVHRGTGKLQWTWNVSKGWPHERAKVDHLVAYQDRNDELRSLIAVDDSGYTVSFRMYGFIPTPSQEASGLTSRSLADQATAKLRASEKPAEAEKAAEQPAQ